MKQIIEILIVCGVIFIGICVGLNLLIFIGICVGLNLLIFIVSSLEDFFNKK